MTRGGSRPRRPRRSRSVRGNAVSCAERNRSEIAPRRKPASADRGIEEGAARRGGRVPCCTRGRGGCRCRACARCRGRARRSRRPPKGRTWTGAAGSAPTAGPPHGATSRWVSRGAARGRSVRWSARGRGRGRCVGGARGETELLGGEERDLKGGWNASPRGVGTRGEDRRARVRRECNGCDG